MDRRFTNWQKFKNYIHTFKIGDIITRKMLRENTHIVSTNTIDSFRRCLEKNNMIKKIEEFRGAYIICHELPENMTLNELMLRGYGRKPKEVPKLIWGTYETNKIQDIIYVHEDGIEPDPLYSSTNSSIFNLI